MVLIQNRQRSDKYLCPWCGENHRHGSKISEEHIMFLREQQKRRY